MAEKELILDGCTRRMIDVKEEKEFVDFILRAQEKAPISDDFFFCSADDSNKRRIGFIFGFPARVKTGEKSWWGGWAETMATFSLSTASKILSPYGKFLCSTHTRSEFARTLKAGNCLLALGFSPCKCKSCKK